MNNWIYEFIIIFILFFLFCMMMIVEAFSIWEKNKPNFFYEIHIQNNLQPKLKSMNNKSDILEFLINENNDTSVYLWRQVVFISFFISFLSSIIIKIFYLNITFSLFILLYITIFFCSFLLLSLQNYHYYNYKSLFMNECLQKYKSLL